MWCTRARKLLTVNKIANSQASHVTVKPSSENNTCPLPMHILALCALTQDFPPSSPRLRSWTSRKGPLSSSLARLRGLARKARQPRPLTHLLVSRSENKVQISLEVVGIKPTVSTLDPKP